MTTFTEQEVAFLQSRGNEACRKIWMGQYDPNCSILPDFRDPQKVKEFLQEKYEKKKWYIPPDQVKLPAARSSSSASSRSITPEVKPLRTLLGDAAPALTVSGSTQNQVSQSQVRLSQHRNSQQQLSHLQGVPTKKGSTDLLADIGGDPFAAPQPSQTFSAFPAFGGQVTQQAAFANFDAFSATTTAPAFGTIKVANPTSFQGQRTTTGSRMIANSYSFGSNQVSEFGTIPRATCRLPDMTNIFGTGANTSSVFEATNQVPMPFQNTGPSYGAFTNPFAASVPQPSMPSTNPFQNNGVVPGAGYSMSAMTSYPAPPIAQGLPQTFHQQTLTQHSPFGHPQNGDSLSGFATTRTLYRIQGPPDRVHTNPFMVGHPSGTFVSRPPATNPFL